MEGRQLVGKGEELKGEGSPEVLLVNLVFMSQAQGSEEKFSRFASTGSFLIYQGDYPI